MDLFKNIVEPDPNLFYKRDDPNDPRLGEVVLTGVNNYQYSEFVILGSPQDEGVKRNKGRLGAAKAPDQIRKEFYKFAVQGSLVNKKIFDLGNVNVNGPLEEVHGRQKEIVEQILGDGKRLIILGGGNDISYPDCAGLAEKFQNHIVFNIDSHFDVRKNNERNSGTPYRQLLDEGLIKPESFFQLAGKSYTNSDAYKKYLEEKGVLIYSLESLRLSGIKKLLQNILTEQYGDAIFWGFDMDSVRSSDAPGVSAAYPVGLTAEEACEIASAAGHNNQSRIFEISEVNPDFDIDNRTAKLAAILMIHFIQG